MEQLIILLGASMTTMEIVEKIEETIQEYKENPEENAKHHLGLMCAVYLTHIKTNGSISEATKMMDDFEKFKQRDKLFKVEKN